MISDYFEAPWRIEQMRQTCVGRYLDGFSQALAEAGYSSMTISDRLRAADHLGRWSDHRGIHIESWDDGIVERFGRHVFHRKPRGRGWRCRELDGARLLLSYLRTIGVVAVTASLPTKPGYSWISEQFAEWMVRHRGVMPSTTARYQRALQPFLRALGEESSRYSVAAIRSYVIEHLADVGRSETRCTVSALRAFLRFLVVEGRIASGIERCVPTVPQWRLSSLPRYLEANDVERVLNSCCLTTEHSLRDHAILVLLARLGLRAGDIVRMKEADIDWRAGTLGVQGKGRREVRLPLPQDVGDAVLAYLERRRPGSGIDRLFLSVNAPTRPFASSSTVSDIVRVALERAGIRNPPSRGAHLLRHSAATTMLCAGSSLESVAAVLRHRSPDTTAYYAKVDVSTLQHVAQPWPGGATC